MSPRGAALLAAIIVIACAGVAGVAIGVPWPAIAAGVVISLGIVLRLTTRWRRAAPPPVRQ